MQFVSRSLRATNILLRDTKYCAWKLLCSANPFVRKTFENLILNLIIAKIGKETNWRNEFLIWISCKHQSSFKAHKAHLRYIIWHNLWKVLRRARFFVNKAHEKSCNKLSNFFSPKSETPALENQVGNVNNKTNEMYPLIDASVRPHRQCSWHAAINIFLCRPKYLVSI